MDCCKKLPIMQMRRKNTRFFCEQEFDNIYKMRNGFRECDQVIAEIHGTGKVYPWSQNTQQLSRPRFKSK